MCFRSEDYGVINHMVFGLQLNKAIAMDLLNPYLTQQEIANRHGCHVNTIKLFKKDLSTKIPELGKIVLEELQAADLD
ncbi:MAG: hypothetical protein WAP14_02170, partial [Acetomicrobium sp.]